MIVIGFLLVADDARRRAGAWRPTRSGPSSASHLSTGGAGRLGPAIGAPSDEQLVEAVANGESIASVLRALGFVPNGGMHRYIKAKITTMDLDTSHFTGQGWSKGKKFPWA